MINYEYMCFKNEVKKNPIPFMVSISEMLFWDWLEEESWKLMVAHGMSQAEAVYYIASHLK